MTDMLADRVTTPAGHWLWRSHATAVLYAEARWLLYGTPQRVTGELYQGRWCWRVTKARRREVSEPCS